MTDQQANNDGLTRLRRLAEQRRPEQPPDSYPVLSDEDCRRLVHEMQVHQIELEMQNEELRMTQEQLSESLEKYADLFEFAPVGYVTANRKGRILEANLTFAAKLGIERGRLINSALSLHAAEADRETFRKHLEQVFGEDERQTCELRLQRRKGRPLHVQVNTIRALAADGEPVSRSSITDITARVEAEEALGKLSDQLEQLVEERTLALRASEQKFRNLSQEFRALLQAISDTLVLLSPEMEILWINGPTSLDQDHADQTRNYCYQLLHDRGTLRAESAVTRCFATGQSECAVTAFNGAVLDIKAFPILEAGRVHSVLLLVGDITEKMALQAEAIQTGHLASLGELAAGVAHEINNPITGIINYGQILLNESPAESLGQDIGARVVKEGERVGRIVKALLSYAQNDRRKEKRLVCLANVLSESTVLTLAQMRKEGIQLTIDLPPDLPQVEANFQQIQQCCINIINNARYALNEKYPGRDPDKRLDITGESVTVDGRACVRLIFHDRGGGIAPEHLPVLTKPFFSTQPFGKGTGLGLNLTRKIITDHGGDLCFASVQGEFTRVIIELPVHQRDARAAA